MMVASRPAEKAMPPLDEFAEVIKRHEPLAPYTYLKLGGPAEMLVQPRSLDELSRVVRRCSELRLPLRVLGSGCNLLVRDEGVPGVVLRLNEPAFTGITVEGKRVRAGTGASVSALISQAARHGLGGLETLVAIPATVRDPNYFLVHHPEATARDVLRLIDLVRSRVQERFNVPLEQEITVW